jgi:hypothetical protein
MEGNPPPPPPPLVLVEVFEPAEEDTDGSMEKFEGWAALPCVTLVLPLQRRQARLRRARPCAGRGGAAPARAALLRAASVCAPSDPDIGRTRREGLQGAGCRCESSTVAAQGRTMRRGGRQADEQAGASGSSRGPEQQQQGESDQRAWKHGEQSISAIAEGSE